MPIPDRDAHPRVGAADPQYGRVLARGSRPVRSPRSLSENLRYEAPVGFQQRPDYQSHRHSSSRSASRQNGKPRFQSIASSHVLTPDLRLSRRHRQTSPRPRCRQGNLRRCRPARCARPRSSRACRVAGVKVVASDSRRLDGMVPQARHQGVIARVEGGRQVAHLDDVLDTLGEPAFLLSWTASPIRATSAPVCASPMPPASSRHRAQGPLGGIDRRRAEGPPAAPPKPSPRDGHQSRADVARNWGTRHPGDRHQRRGAMRSIRRQWPPATAWVLGAEGGACAALTRENSTSWCASRCMARSIVLNVSVAAGLLPVRGARRRRS